MTRVPKDCDAAQPELLPGTLNVVNQCVQGKLRRVHATRRGGKPAVVQEHQAQVLAQLRGEEAGTLNRAPNRDRRAAGALDAIPQPEPSSSDGASVRAVSSSIRRVSASIVTRSSVIRPESLRRWSSFSMT